MKKVLVMLAVIALTGIGYGFEQELTSTPVLVLPAVDTQATVQRTNGMTVAAGDAMLVNGIACQACVSGTTDTATQTNVANVTDTTTVIVTGGMTPDVAGTYLYKGELNYHPVYTQGLYAVSFNQDKYRISLASGIGKSVSNCFIASTLTGVYTANTAGAYSGVATNAYKVDEVQTITEKAPTLNASGPTVDGTVNWLRIPRAGQTAVILTAVDGIAVWTDAGGNKLYGDHTLPAYKGALYGASTGGTATATAEIFTY